MAMASTPVTLTYVGHQRRFQDACGKALMSNQFSDVTLACEGESIKCHRIILASCSSYFDKILTETQGNYSVIYMTDMKIWELKALVNLMYNGQVSIQKSQLPSVMKAAKSINIGCLEGAAPRGGNSSKTAEARTVSESTVPAKIISTFKRPSSGGSDNRYVSAAVKRPAISAQIRPVKPDWALQAQPRYSAAGVLETMKRKIELNNMQGCLEGAAPRGGNSSKTAEARTVSESTVPAKIISTFKRPSSGGSDNRYVSAAVKRPAISAQIRPVKPDWALQAQPGYSAAGVLETMKRKIELNNMQCGPPKLIRMQPARSNGINNLGVRTTTWGGVRVAKPNQNGVGGSPLGQVIGYENEDYADDDEMDQATGDDDSQGLQGIDGGEQSLNDVEPTTNGQVENGDEDNRLERNQADEQFDDGEETPYEAEMDGEGGLIFN